MKRPTKRKLKPVHPSAVIREQYAARLTREIDDMQRSLVYWITAQWRKQNPLALAQDASPAREMKKLLRKRGRLWRTKFRELAPKLAKHFADKSRARVDREMHRMLRDHGFTVRFRMTREMNDVVQAAVADNVTLISSVASEHMDRLEGIVMRSMQQGRDLQTMTAELQDALGIARRRAETIARNQANQANAVMVKTRQTELGITKAIWQHSSGGKHPRKEHIAFSGSEYEIAKGHDFHNGEGVVWPGTAINCRCISIPILPELG